MALGGKDIVTSKKAAEDWLHSIPGVVGVGVGPKYSNGRRIGQLAIVVTVEKKRPLDQIPGNEQIPAEIDGFKTDVLEGGPTVRLLPGSGSSDNVDTTEYPVLRGGI